MDDFVRNTLNEWGFSEWTERFEDQRIDTESLYCLDEHEIDSLIPIVGPRSKFKKRLKLLKEQNTANPETVDSPTQVCPSTSGTSDEGKRRLDLQGESSQSPTKKQRLNTKPGSDSEEIILSEVKTIMRYVHQKIPSQDNKLNNFLREKICGLDTDKREKVGVFGKSGAGKSSLINAVIGVKDLLPSGRVSACTSVMIKVEANMQNSKYEADIEFITAEEWTDELWFLLNFLGDDADQESNQKDDDDRRDIVEKLSALYGEDCEKKSREDLMDGKYFREIPEFRLRKKKTLTGETAKELSEKLVIYTRSDPKDGEGQEVKRWYWPLVKCVTIRVPNNDLLKHVTIVDLPGNGDRNKGRDKMWQQVVGSCSTVWIVTDMNRAVAEPEAWEILKSASSFMGNAGECRHIHFICTKSDLIEDSEDRSAAGVRDFILKANDQAKKEVRKEFSKLHTVKKHFSDKSFKVFTVSSKEFLKTKLLHKNDTEIPKLRKFLQNLNDRHSESLNYVSRALGILSLIQGASRREGADIKTAVCTFLKQKIRHELDVTVELEMVRNHYKELMGSPAEEPQTGLHS
ncbi:nuclear GTPase SLIP-GC-like [Anoplopoma fimbria]|uniref:nuclear GTPase SLIP-GC-like n=1 Tax=Anoplopoma fimbria TaxID=229290 RepID=UPI0023EAEE51|nr:nuclear GTPase SLIP-GC-like [Anoplopoma fimbria]